MLDVLEIGADNSGIVDCSEVIQRALDSGTKTVVLPSGIYRLNSGITVPSGVELIGQRANIHFYGEGVAITLNCSQHLPRDNELTRPRISGFYLENKTGLRKPGTTGIWMRHATRIVLERVTVKGFEIGLDTSGASWASQVVSCWFWVNRYGVYLGATNRNYVKPEQPGYVGPAVYSGFNGGTISGCEIQGNRVGIYFESYDGEGTKRHSHGCSITNNIIEGNTGAGVVIGNFASGVKIRDNYFEINATDGKVDPTSDSVLLWRSGERINSGQIRWSKKDRLAYKAITTGVTSGDDDDLANGTDSGVKWEGMDWPSFGEVVKADIVLASHSRAAGLTRCFVDGNEHTATDGPAVYVDRAGKTICIGEVHTLQIPIVARQRSLDYGNSAVGFRYTGKEVNDPKLFKPHLG